MDRGDAVTERYSRQAVLPEIGPEGQARLASARVLVIGAGGLGSFVLPILVGAGVGHLVIIDHDHVELSNLHRQPLFRMGDIGRPKAEAARDAMAEYNPEPRIEYVVERFEPDNAVRLIDGMDLVIDAADSLAVTYIASDACHQRGITLVSASVLGQQGYVGAFCGGAPSYRAVFPNMPSTVGSCAENGVFGSAVGIMGSFQAHFALQLLLGHEPSPLGRLISLDLRTMSFGGFSFLGATEPEGAPIPFIARTHLEATDLVVELRDEAEAPQSVVANAVRILPDAIKDSTLPDDRRLVLCCRSGIRAHRAAKMLQDRGYSDLAVLAAGD